MVEWCTNNSNNKFGTEDSVYKLILSWCFLNPKTIEQEMASDNKQIYSEQNADHEEWKEAWNKYNKNKVSLGLAIAGDNLTDLNGSAEVEGGKALHKWCNEKKQDPKKLYEDGMEEIYTLFKQWCTK